MNGDQSLRESVNTILQTVESLTQGLHSLREDAHRPMGGQRVGEESREMPAGSFDCPSGVVDLGVGPRVADPADVGETLLNVSVEPVHEASDVVGGGLHVFVHVPTVASVTVTITPGVLA